MNEREIFQAAVEIADTHQRRLYLDTACGTDKALREQIEQLLRSHENISQFLAVPAAAQLTPNSNDQAEDTTVQPKSEMPQPLEDDAVSLEFLEPSTKSGSCGRLAHYEVLEILGRGAFGIVLKAFDEKLHRMVAIKVMNPELAATSPPRKRFLREAQSSAKVRHENIVAIHAVEEQPVPYLVMEYIPGGTLQQRLDAHGPLELTEILRLGQQIATGLAAAHAQGLIHRDIKPANILLESGIELRAKITDFGLARATDDASLTQSGLIAGTPMYMAPEQAKGQALDHRADLFSLGSVLYTMTSGRPPFRAPNTIAVLKRLCEEAPRPITEVIPETPLWLCDIISKLHAKEPDDRYQSAKEVADALTKTFDYLQNPAAAPQSLVVATPKGKTDTTAEAALKSLRGPGLGLIITACLNVFDTIGLMLASSLVWNRPVNEAVHVRPAELVLLMIVIVGSAAILMGGLNMRRGQRYGLCLLGCIAALFVGPMIIVGWPVAIWGLIVLNRPHVRALFSQPATAADQIRPTAAARPPMPAWAVVIIALSLLPVIGCLMLIVALALPAYQAAQSRSTVSVPQGKGILWVRSDDRRVIAKVDDREMRLLGPDGIELSLDAGPHVVTFIKDGLHLSSQTVNVVAGGGHYAHWPPKTATVPADGSSQDETWQPLFNGRDLTGWMTHPQQPGNWRVEDGAIVGSGSVSHLFTTQDDFHDFEFRGEVRLNQDGNSGVFIRTPFAMMDPNAAVTNPPGYEVQLVAGNQIQPAQMYLSGGVIPLAQAEGSNRIHQGRWYKFRVKAVGDKFETWIDDVQTVSAIDPLRKYQGGYIALQVWAPQTKVEFRNLEARSFRVPTLADANFAGVWDSAWGPVTFKTAMLDVNGTYAKGTIDGIVDPRTRTFQGRFNENTQSGRLQMTLSEDGQSIVGWYDYINEPFEKSQPRQSWNMTRTHVVQSPPPAIAPFDAAQAAKHQEEWAAHLKVPVEYTNSLGMKFRLIPPGEFLMGSPTPAIDKLSRELEQAGANDFEKFVARFSGPQHRVRITKPFYLAEHEVTVGQYRRFIANKKYLPTMQQLGIHSFKWEDSAVEPNAEDRAVVGISWDDADAFCRWVAEHTGLVTEIPTEAQWEYACRAGTETLWSFGDDPSQLSEYAVFSQPGFIPAEVVGSKKANPFGLFDMHGNADEWCRDWHDKDFYSKSPVDDPMMLDNPTDKNSGRVARGGTAHSAAWWTYSTTRPWDFPATPNTPKGVRVMMSADAVREALHAPPDEPVSALEPENEWSSLFNGKSLAGWKTHPGKPGDWHVEDGALISGSTANYLFTERSNFANFHLRLEARINAGGDSGVLFRTPFLSATKNGLEGYEAQIQNGTPSVPGWKSGAIANVTAQTGWRFLQHSTATVERDEWFPMEIIAIGTHIETWVAGKKAAEFNDPDRLHTRGHIALQQSTASQVMFRNIQVRPLTP